MTDDTRRKTLADIAKLAGVGLGTASRALNNSPGIADATRLRVLAVAEEHHYVVSPEASRLAKGATGRVGLLVPHLSRWFFGAVVEGLASVLRQADLDVVLYPVGSLNDREDFFKRMPARRKVDAVVVVAFPVDDDERRRLEIMGVQIVAAGGQTVAYPHVRIDDYRAGRQAVDHLLFLGHRRIAMLEATDPDQPNLISMRSDAYYDALAENGIEPLPELVVTADWGGEHGAHSMGQLLALSQPPTAVYAHSDEVALGAIRSVRRAGLQIPGDISVVGIDDHPLAALSDLTTVRQDPFEQGRRTGEMLLGLLNGADVDQAVTMPTELIIRHSAAPPSVSRS